MRAARGGPRGCGERLTGGELVATSTATDVALHAAVAAIQEIFPSAAELSALMARDNARYLAALDQAGVPRDAPDPVSRVYLQYTTDPIGLAQPAAELRVTPAALRARVGDLPELAVLAHPSATIPRSTLVEGSARALCALATRNRPAICPRRLAISANCSEVAAVESGGFRSRSMRVADCRDAGE